MAARKTNKLVKVLFERRSILMNKKTTFTGAQKARRGWWASVVFMLLVVGLIVFLTYVKIVEENRDVLVGIIGMLTGSISSMLAIASGRDPGELQELRDRLTEANTDRAVLINRLRDSQIQAELRTQQICELQEAVIEKLSIFRGENPIQTKEANEVILPSQVEEWLPKVDRDNF
jgi:hypothetical protein